MKITRRQLRQIIKEELNSVLEGQSKPITGYPGELPVDVDKTTAIQRYKQQMASLETQIAQATASTEKEALQGQLQDVSDAHDALVQTTGTAAVT